MRDYINGCSDAIDESFEKGVEKGAEKQRVESEKKRDDAIKALLAQKVAPDIIANAYGITVKEILNIKEK